MRKPELRCVSCDSLNLKPISDNLYKCPVCKEFTDNDEEFQFEKIKQHKKRYES